MTQETQARTLTLFLPIPDPLLTINARRRMHWREQARETRRQRQDAGWWFKRAKNIPQDMLPAAIFGRAIVRVDVEVYPRKGMQRHDDSAIWEALKPIFDALEDVWIVRNDRQLTHGALAWMPQRTGEFKLTLIAEVAA